MSSRVTRKLIKVLDPKYIDTSSREEFIEDAVENKRRKQFLSKFRGSRTLGTNTSLTSVIAPSPSAIAIAGTHSREEELREHFRKGLTATGRTLRRGARATGEGLGVAASATGRALEKGARATREGLGVAGKYLKEGVKGTRKRLARTLRRGHTGYRPANRKTAKAVREPMNYKHPNLPLNYTGKHTNNSRRTVWERNTPLLQNNPIYSPQESPTSASTNQVELLGNKNANNNTKPTFVIGTPSLPSTNNKEIVYKSPHLTS